MEAGACGWSSQIAGEIGNVQLDYDGTPMVTDCMTEREIIAFARALGSIGRGVVQTHRVARHRRTDRARERPADHLERAARRRCANQHGRGEYTARDALKQLADYNEEEGLRIYAQALTTNFVSEFTFEDYNLLDTMAVWKEALLGTVEEKQAKLADPERRRR